MIFLFWCAVFLILYCYFGYPLVAAVWARLASWPVRRAAFFPSVSIVISVWNEDDVIAAKVRSLLAVDYPAEKLEILIGSDGSTDRTDEIGRGLADPRVRFFSFPARRGKPAVLNDLMVRANGDIILFNDARQRLAPEALRAIVDNFSDPKVGCVSGELVFERPQSATGKGVDFYWRYEKFIRLQESRIHSMLGATGAFYAIRRELFEPFPKAIILDDMYAPFQIILKGYRAIFENTACAYDRVAEDPNEEYRRKVRTIAGNYQIYVLLPQMFNPARSPVAFQLFSHKFLRVLMPFVLVLVLFSNSILSAVDWMYLWLFLLQVMFYGLAGIGAFLQGRSKSNLKILKKICYIPYTFCLLNLSAIAGFWRFIRAQQDIMWEKARG